MKRQRVIRYGQEFRPTRLRNSCVFSKMATPKEVAAGELAAVMASTAGQWNALIGGHCKHPGCDFFGSAKFDGFCSGCREQPPMRVTVKTMLGESYTFTVEASTLIGELRSLMMNKTGPFGTQCRVRRHRPVAELAGSILAVVCGHMQVARQLARSN